MLAIPFAFFQKFSLKTLAKVNLFQFTCIYIYICTNADTKIILNS